MSQKDDPYEFIRVKDRDTGYHQTILRMNLPNGNYQELKQDAVDSSGRPLEPDFAPGDPSAAQSKES